MTEKKTAEEIYPFIYRIRLPIGGEKPGPVNVYLFKGETNTLLDTGILKTTDRLLQGIEEAGLSLSEIDRIVLTHGHVDHYGAAAGIRKRAGRDIPVFLHAEDEGMVTGDSELSHRQVNTFLKKMGSPFLQRHSMRILSFIWGRMVKHCSVTDYLCNGQFIQLGKYSARIIETPGHSKGGVCLFIEDEGILFSGDTLLPHITPNAFFMLEPGVSWPVRLSQEEFYDSISRIEGVNPLIVFPGHGAEIKNVKEVAEMYRCQYEKRDRKILDIIEKNELTVYEIARLLFPDLKGIKKQILDIYLAVSEVFTHLQVLEKKGLVRFKRDGRKAYVSLK